MKRAIRQLLLPAVVLASFASTAPAVASWETILQDCIAHNGLQGDYTRSQLQDAKSHVTGERVAYTECMAEISAAMALGNAKSDDGPGGGDGSGTVADSNGDGVVNPDERRAARKKKRSEAREIASINDTLTPDAVGLSSDDDSGGVGASTVIALILLALAAIGGGTWYAARRNPAFADALRRVPLPGRRG